MKKLCTKNIQILWFSIMTSGNLEILPERPKDSCTETASHHDLKWKSWNNKLKNIQEQRTQQWACVRFRATYTWRKFQNDFTDTKRKPQKSGAKSTWSCFMMVSDNRNLFWFQGRMKKLCSKNIQILWFSINDVQKSGNPAGGHAKDSCTETLRTIIQNENLEITNWKILFVT